MQLLWGALREEDYNAGGWLREDYGSSRNEFQGGVGRVLEKTITGTEEKAREAEEGARDGQGEAGRVVGKLAGLYAGIAPPTTRMC